MGASHPSTSSGEPLSLKSVPPAHFARPPQMPFGGGMGGLVLAAARKAPASLRSRPPKCRRPTCSPLEVLVPRRCHAMKLNHPNPLFFDITGYLMGLSIPYGAIRNFIYARSERKEPFSLSKISPSLTADKFLILLSYDRSETGSRVKGAKRRKRTLDAAHWI